MSQLDDKINQHFAGLVVRKDLVKTVKGNAIVPSYVLEYLLGQYCATNDEATIQAGIDTVREILRKHYVHRNEAGLVRSTIKEKGRHKVIDRISVALNDKSDAYEAGINVCAVRASPWDYSRAPTVWPRMFAVCGSRFRCYGCDIVTSGG